MFIQKRRFKIIFFLIASILAFGSIFFIMGLDTKAKMISAGVGGTLGILTCLYIQLANSQASDDPNVNGTDHISRWMIPSVLTGTIFARVVIESFEPELQNIVMNFVSAWLTFFFAYLTIRFWWCME
jgi:hypothetical protein